MQNFILNFISKRWILSFGFLLGILLSLTAQIRDTQLFPMEQFMGVNLRREDPIHRLNCVGFVREYHDWAIDEANVYNIPDSLSSLRLLENVPNNKFSWNLQ